MYIRTERLTIRPLCEGDDASLSVMLRDDQIKKTYMLPDFEDEQQCMKLVRRLRELSADESRYVAGISRGEELVGFLNDVEIRDGSIEMGYFIAPAHWNLGYATEALTAVITHLRKAGFRQVRTGAFEENIASIRVMEKAGMTRLEVMETIEYRGKRHTCVLFAAE